jgi:hypothetical protein
MHSEKTMRTRKFLYDFLLTSLYVLYCSAKPWGQFFKLIFDVRRFRPLGLKPEILPPVVFILHNFPRFWCIIYFLNVYFLNFAWCNSGKEQFVELLISTIAWITFVLGRKWMKQLLGRNWGRCYDHNFWRFLTIFGKKLAFFSKTNVMIKILHNLPMFWVKNANFFAIFLRKYF